MSNTSDQNSGWNNAPWESSLSHGSLNDPSATSQPSAPDPFSRQGSDPSDGLGSDPEAAPQPTNGAGAWPTYPDQDPVAPDPAPTAPYSGGYGSPAPPAPPTQPHPAANAYGSNPYEANPYESNPYASNPYEVTPYQASYGGYGAYGIVPTVHPQAVPALVTGIIGLALCPLVGIVGLVLGNKARQGIDAEPGRFSGRGQATAGFVLGIISVVATVMYVIFFAVGLSGGFDT